MTPGDSFWPEERRDRMHAERDAEAARLFAYLGTIADPDAGSFALAERSARQRLGLNTGQLYTRLNRLMAAGCLRRTGKARYRLTGVPFVAYAAPPAAPVVAVQRGVRATVFDVSCSYPTCREMGIEPVVRMLHNRTLGGEVGVADIAISLARIPSLERPLPDPGRW